MKFELAARRWLMERMRQAGRITDRAIHHILGYIKPGVRESELAAAAPVPLVLPRADVVAAPPPPPAEASTPIYKKWWLWTIIGVVVAGAVTGAVLATTLKSSSSCPPNAHCLPRLR